MKNVLIVLVVFVLLNACVPSRQVKPSLIGLVPLENYYVPMSNSSDTGYSYKVFNSQEEFDKEIQQGIPAGVTRKPDFNGQVVVAVIYRTGPNRRNDLVMDSAKLGGENLQIYYHVKGVQSSTVTTYLPGLGLATVPRSQSVKQVNFYEDGTLVKTVPVSIY